MGLFDSIGRGLSKIGKGFKKLVTDPGEWAKNAGRSVGGVVDVASDFLPPGLRQLGEFGGSVLQGNNLGEHAMRVGGSLIPGIGSIPGLDKLGGFAGGALKKIGGFAGGALSDLVPSGIEGAVRGGLRKIGGLSPSDVLAGIEGARGVYDLGQSYNQRNKALRSAEGAYNERSGLRRLGVEGMMNETPPELSSLYSDPSNPYNQQPNQPPRVRGLKRIGSY